LIKLEYYPKLAGQLINSLKIVSHVFGNMVPPANVIRDSVTGYNRNVMARAHEDLVAFTEGLDNALNMYEASGIKPVPREPQTTPAETHLSGPEGSFTALLEIDGEDLRAMRETLVRAQSQSRGVHNHNDRVRIGVLIDQIDRAMMNYFLHIGKEGFGVYKYDEAFTNAFIENAKKIAMLTSMISNYQVNLMYAS